MIYAFIANSVSNLLKRNGCLFICVSVLSIASAEVEAFVPPSKRTTLLGIHFQAQFVGRALGTQLVEEVFPSYGITPVLYAAMIALALHSLCVAVAQSKRPDHQKHSI